MIARLFLTAAALAASLRAGTTITGPDTYAYGANIGWINLAGDGAGGAVVGEFYCSGFLYSANVGWINLGSGTPASGFAWTNTDAGDCGVNTTEYVHTGSSIEARLRGFAWGANIGWVQFENTGNPRVDLTTGQLHGDVWCANAGWIRLDGALTVPVTTLSAGPDTDADTIPDAWEYARAGDLRSLSAVSDLDGDGRSDRDEYLADSNPRDPGDQLELLDYSASTSGNLLRSSFKWASRPTRLYDIESTADFTTRWSISLGSIVPEDGPSTTASFIGPVEVRQFHRITPRLPLP